MVPTWITVVACVTFVSGFLWVFVKTHPEVPSVVWFRRKIRRAKVKLATRREAKRRLEESRRFQYHRWSSRELP